MEPPLADHETGLGHAINVNEQFHSGGTCEAKNFDIVSPRLGHQQSLVPISTVGVLGSGTPAGRPQMLAGVPPIK